MEWRYHWPADDDSDCVLLLVWCVVWELKSVLCSIRFRHSMFVCCVVMMCIGETGCCDSALVPPFFGGGGGVRGWYRICFLILLRSCFLVWSCSSENFVVVSAGWDIRVGAEHGVRWCAWCICVLIVFCFVSSSLFFESYGIMRLLFVFVTESLILAQDERWRRA